MKHVWKDPEPMPHQKEAFAFFCEGLAGGRNFVALFAQQGTGKSKMLIDIAASLYADDKIDAVLVIAPCGVHRQWATDEIPKHCAAPRYRVHVFNHKMPEVGVGLLWYCVNVETFSRDTWMEHMREFLTKYRTFVVVDEATTIKNPKAQRTANIAYGLGERSYRGKALVSVKPLSVYRAILTGTPTTNSPFDLFAPFEFLRPGFWGMSFSSFQSRYGLMRKETIPGKVPFLRSLTYQEIATMRRQVAGGTLPAQVASIWGISPLDVRYIVEHPELSVPYKNLGELQRAIAPVAFIKRKKDCLSLPEKTYTKVLVPLSAPQAKAYKELKANAYAQFAGQELDVTTALTLALRLSQIAGGFFPSGSDEVPCTPFEPNPKVEALLRELEESEPPAIVACRFVAEVHAVAAALAKERPDLTVHTITGEVIGARREAIVAGFKSGEIDILVATTSTIARGYNFQHCSTMYIYSQSFSLEEREQLEDRIHRNGQNDTCVYKDFIAEGTIDEAVHAVLSVKGNLLEYFRSKSFVDFLGRR